MLNRLEALEAVRMAAKKFAPLKEAIDDQMPDHVIIRCEVTCGEIRKLAEALEAADAPKAPPGILRRGVERESPNATD